MATTAKLNWGEADKAIRDSKSRGGGRTVNRFIILDGETVSVRFLVNKHEPFIYKRHYSQQARYFVCAEDAAAAGTHDGCVGCYEARRLGKSSPVRLSTRVFAFSLLDPRKFHALDGEGKKKEYVACREGTCKWCRRGNEAKPQGVRHWSISSTVAEQLMTWERDVLGDKCAICQIGRIKVTEYVCPECDEVLEVDDPNEKVRCFECGKGKNVVMVKPREVLKCTKGCAKPRRTSLADAWVMITRSGSDTSTTYNFNPGEVESLGDEYGELQPVDFAHEAEFQPLSAHEMAVKLNCANPFGKGSKETTSKTSKDLEDPDDDIPF